MSLRRAHFDEADWRPHPFAVYVYAAGVALLAWSVYAYAQMPRSQDGCRSTPPCPRSCSRRHCLGSPSEGVVLSFSDCFVAVNARSVGPLRVDWRRWPR